MKPRALSIAIAAVAMSLAAAPAKADTLSDLRKVEEIRWRHTVWPEGSNKSKPAFEVVYPEQQLRAHFDTSRGERRFTHTELQTELDRMAASSRLPSVLREIFEALDNDPGRIVEAVVKPALSGAGSVQPDEDESGPFTLPQIPDAPCANDTWRTLGVSNLPDPRTNHVAVWTGTRMLIYGKSSNSNDTGQSYDPVTDSWSRISAVGAPLAATDSSVVWTGTRMIVWGGDWAALTNQGGIYDPVSDTWTSTTTIGAPSARKNHTAVWTGSRMIIWGGETTGGSLDTGGSYDPASNTWTPLPESIPGPGGERTQHTVVWTGSRMIVWGGGISLNSGAIYDPVSNTWTATSTTGAPVGRAGHAAVWTGSRMLIWGGKNGLSVHPQDGGIYNPTSDTWSAMSTAGQPQPRGRVDGVWTGSQMIVWGGEINAVGWPNTGGVYDASNDSWTTTSMTGAPSGRAGHTMVWTGTELLAWGGSGYLEDSATASTFDDGGRYDPASNTWSPIAYTASFAQRNLAATVWTGTQAIVWGGAISRASGGVYDATTDTWKTMSTINAPSGREEHTGIWTGSRVIVWGGDGTNPGSSVLVDRGDGASYDPVVDTWTPLSSVGAPSPRRLHGAVWTGSKMVVWGGGHFVSGTLVPLQTGAIYDPGTDTWTPTSTIGAPSARSGHAAVWTGSRMIVWGGTGGLGDGALFDPSANAWTVMSSVGAPTPRERFALAWTGRKMIVWGGGTSLSTPQNTGGIYDAASDSWGFTNTVGAPTPRNRASAVWAENRFILWGGTSNNGTAQSSGAMYDLNTGVWTPTTATGAPAPRSGHAALWTGAEMMIVGQLKDTRNYCFVCTPTTWYGDADGDGAGGGFPTPTLQSCAQPAGYVDNTADCDDSDPARRPGLAEICDGKDNDCNAVIPANEADADADGSRICAGDCNDANPLIHPGQSETCNGLDDDCSGQFDDDATGVDSDTDGVRNACDNCRFVTNASQLDSDGDHAGNACDNCVILPNPNQADADGDARGDHCDDCPAIANPAQDDFDSDRVGDACDNCVFEPNTSQSDTNHDGEGDLCDVDDGIIFIVSTDPSYVEWQQENGPTAWNVYEGDLSILRSTGVYTQAPGSNVLADRHCGVADLFVGDADVPAAGKVQFSLVTGVTGGVEGSLGTNGAGTPRANTNPCP